MIPASLFFAFAFGYFLTHLFRVVNAVVGPAISAEIGIDAAGLGFLTSVYFLAFAAIQLPLGLLLDRFGAHRVQATLLVLAAAGSALFAVGEDFLTLTIARGLIGLGVSAGLMSAFKAYSARLPAKKLPLVNSLHMAAGSLGVLAGGLPVELAMQALGWRGLFMVLAGFCLLAAAVLMLVVRDVSRHGKPESIGALIAGVGHILISPAFLRVAPISLIVQASGLALLALWVGPWLRDVALYSPEQAATVVSLMGGSMIVGYVFCALLSNKLVHKGVPLGHIMIGGCIAFTATLPAIILLEPAWGAPLWLLFASLISFAALSYPVLGAEFPPGLTGRVHTALNFLVFIAGFALQWGFGVLVKYLIPHLGVEGAYDVAIWCLVGGEVAALIWYWMRRPQQRAAGEVTDVSAVR
jgi:predicted MFS family arabinose efflux permease